MIVTWLSVHPHWLPLSHICMGNLIIISSDNGLSPGPRQAIIWTNVGILSIGTLGTNFIEILSKIHQFHSRKCTLTHWGRVTHICISKLTVIGSDNGLSPGRRQAIIWTNAGILLIGSTGKNFNAIFIEIHTFSFTKIHLKMSSGKWRPFCLGLNVLKCCLWKESILSWLQSSSGDLSTLLALCGVENSPVTVNRQDPG